VSRTTIRLFPVACFREMNRLASHVILGQTAAPRDLLHRVAVAVARAKIHPGINLCRIAAQGLFDNAVPLDEFAPIRRREESQSADAVADRDLIRRLRLPLGLHKLLDRYPPWSEMRCSSQVFANEK